jgi:hypothetical protein
MIDIYDGSDERMTRMKQLIAEMTCWRSEFTHLLINRKYKKW